MPVEAVGIIQDFQQFAPTYSKMRLYLEELKIKELDKEVEAELPEKVMSLVREDENIEKVAKEILEAMAQEEFINAKHINYELHTYAMEIIDKEESREKKRKEHQKESKKKKKSGLESVIQIGLDT